MSSEARMERPGGAVGSGAWAARPAGVAASGVDIDPVIHAQARLRIMATLAAVPVGDELHFLVCASYWT